MPVVQMDQRRFRMTTARTKPGPAFPMGSRGIPHSLKSLLVNHGGRFGVGLVPPMVRHGLCLRLPKDAAKGRLKCFFACQGFANAVTSARSSPRSGYDPFGHHHGTRESSPRTSEAVCKGKPSGGGKPEGKSKRVRLMTSRFSKKKETKGGMPCLHEGPEKGEVLQGSPKGQWMCHGSFFFERRKRWLFMN